MSLIFCLAVLAQQPVDEDIAKAVDRLYSERNTESESGKGELVEIGPKAVPKIVAELRLKADSKPRFPNARVKRLLCEILGAIREGGSGASDALVAKLEDFDEFGFSVASAAAAALTSIGDASAAPALLRALASKNAETDPWLKYECIRGLGIFRHKEAVEALKKALEDKSAATVGTDERVHLIRAAAASALGKIRAEGVSDNLGKLLADKDNDPYTQRSVAWHAARALEKILKESKGALEGDDKTVNESLAAWGTWWEAIATKRNIEKTRDRMKTISAAIEKYKADQGEYPPVLGYLTTKPPTAKSWPEGGYTKEPLKDAWEHDFIFKSPGTGAPFDLVSKSKDNRDWGKGDDADLWNHEAWRTIKAEATKKVVEETAKLIVQFTADQGQAPDTLMDLKNKPSYAKKWDKAYVSELPKDGYGHALLYRKGGFEGEPFDLWSEGADQAKGGSAENADVWSHEKWKGPAAETTKTRLAALAKAVEAFRKAEERLPEELKNLKEKPSWAKKWPTTPGGHTTEALTDGFGNDFVYTVTDSGKGVFEIKSLGADGKAGGTGADEDLSSAAK